MTSRLPCWCPKTMKQRPCWCPKLILKWELNSYFMQTLSFVLINLHRCWPREWKHSIGLDWQNNNFARTSLFFCTFLCRRCTTTTWKCLISRLVEDVNTRQRLSFSFPKLWYSLLKFKSRKNCQHLTKWTSRNKCDKVWSSANSPFKWRFRCRWRRCYLN